MKKRLIGLGLIISLAGCATAPVQEATTEVSSFDGSTKVFMMPETFKCVNSFTTCASIGFAWQSTYPEEASVFLEVTDHAVAGSYHPIRSVRLNIDGEIVSLKQSPVSMNDFKNSSGNYQTRLTFIAPVALLEKIKSSKDTKMQILSEGAVIEDGFKTSEENNKAYQAMLNFLVKVNAAK